MSRHLRLTAFLVCFFAASAAHGGQWKPVSTFTAGPRLDVVRFGYLHWSKASGDTSGDTWDVDNSFGNHGGKLRGGPRPEQFALWGDRFSIEWDFQVPADGEYVVTICGNVNGPKDRPWRIAYSENGGWIEAEPVTLRSIRGWGTKLVSWRIRLPAGKTRFRLGGELYAWWVGLSRPWESEYIKGGRVVKARPILRRSLLAARNAKSGKVRPEALLVLPQGRRFDEALAELKASFRKASGVELPVKEAGKLTAEDRKRYTLLLPGSMEHHPLLEKLYWREYHFTTEQFPGRGGHVVRTVYDPWGAGRNVVVLGGSDPAGVLAAVRAFVAAWEPGADDGSLGFSKFLLQKFGPEVAARAHFMPSDRKLKAFRTTLKRKILPSGWETGSRSYLTNTGQIGMWYARSGRRECAELLRDRILKMTREPVFNVGTDDHMALWLLWRGWILTEHSPAISDADRLKITDWLLQTTHSHEAFERIHSWYQNSYNPSTTLRHNHQTVNALGIFLAADYFGKYYRLPFAKVWNEKVNEICAPATRTFKATEDSNNYQWHSVKQAALWSLWSGSEHYFTSGNLARACRRLMICRNNFGTPANYGDCWGPFESGDSNDVLEIALRKYRKGRYQFALDLFHNNHRKVMKGHYWHNLEDFSHKYYFRKAVVPAEQPKDLLGVAVMPIPQAYHDYYSGKGGDLGFWAERKERPAHPPLAKCFDKISLRRSFDPDDEYLLLQGVGPTNHAHYDANAIVQVCARGRIFLVDYGYQRSEPRHHSMLEIVRDGTRHMWSRYPKASRWADFREGPAFAELVGANDSDRLGLLSSKLAGINGVDWTRHMVWLKGRGFLVLDEVVAKTAGKYDFTNRWRAVGKSAAKGRSLTVEQEGQRLLIVNADASELSLTTDRKDEKATYKFFNQSYKWAAMPPMVWEQKLTREMTAGDRCVFVNLLWFGKDDAEVKPSAKHGATWQVDGVHVGIAEGKVFAVEAGGEKLELK